VRVEFILDIDPLFERLISNAHYFAAILLRIRHNTALPQYDNLAIIIYKQPRVHPRAYQTRNRFALEFLRILIMFNSRFSPRSDLRSYCSLLTSHAERPCDVHNQANVHSLARMGRYMQSHSIISSGTFYEFLISGPLRAP